MEGSEPVGFSDRRGTRKHVCAKSIESHSSKMFQDVSEGDRKAGWGKGGPVQRTKWTRVNRYAPFPAFRLPCLFSVFPAQGNLMSDSRSNKEYEIKMCGWPDVYLSSRRAAVLFSFSCALFKAVISWFKLRRMTEAYV